MASKPLTNEAIALTEKKMDMTLDDIIKMSKSNASKTKKQRAPNKSRKFSNGSQDKSLKVRQYMDSRSSMRQGVLAQRRSNFQGNRFPITSEAARRAAAAPLRGRAFGGGRMANWNKQRACAPIRQQGNTSTGGNVAKPKQQQQTSGEGTTKQRPKTLDSLFANMKEQRLRAFSHPNNAPRGGVGNQQKKPFGRGRYSSSH